MRKIGDLSQHDASNRFIAYLRSQKISGEVREEQGAQYSLWVYDEDQIEAARAEFERFSARMDAPEYTHSALKDHLHDPQKSVLKARIKPQIRLGGKSDIPVTLWIMGACAVLALFSQVSYIKPLLVQYFHFSAAIFEGQIWRLFTPTLMHTAFLQLIFNMFWVYDLGGNIEREEGSKFYLIFVLVLSLWCNIALFLLSGPHLNGMSGVVYGLIGYVWIMARYKAGTRYALSDLLMAFMVCWIFIGLIIPTLRFDYTQQVAGILLGLSLGGWRSGYLSAHLRRWRRK